MTFTVQDGADGWAATVDERGVIQLTSKRNALDELVFALPASFGEKGNSLFDSVRDQGAQVSEAVPVSVGGLAGTQVDVVVQNTTPGTDGLIIFTDPEGSTFFAQPRDNLQLIEIPRGDGVLVILIDAPSPAEFSVVTKLAAAVLATLHFE